MVKNLYSVQKSSTPNNVISRSNAKHFIVLLRLTYFWQTSYTVLLTNMQVLPVGG